MAYGEHIQALDEGDRITRAGEVCWVLEYGIKRPNVWRAGSPDGRVAVIKFAASTQESINRLRAEYDLNRRLSGRWTARLIDSSFDDDEPTGDRRSRWPLEWIATQYLHFNTIADFVHDEERLEGVRAINFARSLWEAVTEFRLCGVTHRDLSFNNVVVDIDEAHPRVLDLGIGQADDRLIVTESRASFTPGFGAPEQVRNEEITDFRTDIWGWGAVVYFALTGRPLFDEDTENHYAWNIGEETPIAFDHVPAEFVESLQIALSYEVKDRIPEQVEKFLPATEQQRAVAVAQEQAADVAKQLSDLEADGQETYELLNEARREADTSAQHARRVEQLQANATKQQEQIRSLRKQMEDAKAELVRAEDVLRESTSEEELRTRLAAARSQAARAIKDRDAADQRADRFRRVAEESQQQAETFAAELKRRPARGRLWRQRTSVAPAPVQATEELRTSRDAVARLTREVEQERRRVDKAMKETASAYADRLRSATHDGRDQRRRADDAERSLSEARTDATRELHRAVEAEKELRRLKKEIPQETESGAGRKRWEGRRWIPISVGVLGGLLVGVTAGALVAQGHHTSPPLGVARTAPTTTTSTTIPPITTTTLPGPTVPAKPAPNSDFQVSGFRWDPGKPIYYSVVTAGVPPDQVTQRVEDVKAAVAQAAAATGLVFDFNGDYPSSQQDPESAALYSCFTGAEVFPQAIVFSWGSSSGNHYCDYAAPHQMVGGTVSVNLSDPVGSPGEGEDMLFGLGSVLGLQQAPEPGQVMSSGAHYDTYQLGDLNGLWMVGTAGGNSVVDGVPFYSG